jgi:hypothetical protein
MCNIFRIHRIIMSLYCITHQVLYRVHEFGGYVVVFKFPQTFLGCGGGEWVGRIRSTPKHDRVYRTIQCSPLVTPTPQNPSRPSPTGFRFRGYPLHRDHHRRRHHARAYEIYLPSYPQCLCRRRMILSRLMSFLFFFFFFLIGVQYTTL